MKGTISQESQSSSVRSYVSSDVTAVGERGGSWKRRTKEKVDELQVARDEKKRERQWREGEKEDDVSSKLSASSQGVGKGISSFLMYCNL